MPLQPVPGYFQDSFAACERKPLAALRLTPAAAKAVEVSFNLKIVPAIILDDVPKPPVRPESPADAAVAYAPADVPLPPGRRPAEFAVAAGSSEPEGDGNLPPGALSHSFIPLPVRRPDNLDDIAALTKQAPEFQKETKLAMIGAFPGVGMNIGNLTRLTPQPPIINGGCSVDQPYKLMALGSGNRTRLIPPAVVDAAMVSSLVRWEAGMQSAARKFLGEDIVAIQVAASYVCRGVNNVSTTKLSEHARANAIDISGYITRSGTQITIKKDFSAGGEKQAFLRAVHGVTCATFQVVLGPGSDGYHEDHVHMDMGRWKLCR